MRKILLDNVSNFHLEKTTVKCLMACRQQHGGAMVTQEMKSTQNWRTCSDQERGAKCGCRALRNDGKIS